MTIGPNKFIWDVQYAGYSHNCTDQKGETTYSSFIDEFDSFPWMEQIEKASQLPDKVAPTLSIKDLKTGKDYWISMAGDRNENGYIIGFIYPKEKKAFFGLGKPKTIRWLEMYLTEDNQVVKELIKLFFDRSFHEFESKIRKLENFGQMESEDLASNK